MIGRIVRLSIAWQNRWRKTLSLLGCSTNRCFLTATSRSPQNAVANPYWRPSCVLRQVTPRPSVAHWHPTSSSAPAIAPLYPVKVTRQSIALPLPHRAPGQRQPHRRPAPTAQIMRSDCVVRAQGGRSQLFSGEMPIETRQLLAVEAGVSRFGASNVTQSPSPSGLGGGPAMLSGSTIAPTRRR